MIKKNISAKICGEGNSSVNAAPRLEKNIAVFAIVSEDVLETIYNLIIFKVHVS